MGLTQLDSHALRRYVLAALVGLCCLGAAETSFGTAALAPAGHFLAAEGGETVAGPTTLYHYTSADPASIMERGLIPGEQSGNVYLTPDGTLSPIQAHIDLGLSAGRGFPQHLIGVDAQGLADYLGRELPVPSRVTAWPGGGAGGGWEVPISEEIPPWLLKVLR